MRFSFMDISQTFSFFPWHDMTCFAVVNVNIWWQVFNFVLLPLKRWFQFNRKTHFVNALALTTEKWLQKREVTFEMTFGYRWRRVCFNSLLSGLFINDISCHLAIFLLIFSNSSTSQKDKYVLLHFFKLLLLLLLLLLFFFFLTKKKMRIR